VQKIFGDFGFGKKRGWEAKNMKKSLLPFVAADIYVL